MRKALSHLLFNGPSFGIRPFIHVLHHKRRVKTLGFRSLTYIKPTYQILAFCYAYLLKVSVVVVYRVSLVFTFGPKPQLKFGPS